MDENFFEDEPPAPLEQQAGDLPQVDLALERAASPARRKRAIQVSLVVVALVALLVTLRGVILPPRPTTPTLPPSPPSYTIITSNISFGTVTINGQRQRGTVPMLLAERAPSYTITITAPPFRAKSCAFSFSNGTSLPHLNNPGGDCEVGFGEFPEMILNGVTGDATSFVTIEFTAADLPAGQQSQVNTLLLHSITAQQTTTVPSGSYIATSLDATNNITSQRTSVPIQATVFLAPNANFAQNAFICAGLICQVHSSPDELTTRSGMLWDINVPVALRWRFTASAGSVLGDVLFPAADIVPATLVYADTTGWSLSPQTPFNAPAAEVTFGSLDCSTGSQILQQQLQETNWSATMYAGQDISGCQIIMTDMGGSPQGNFIWRFGVLLAGDGSAHKLLPALPVAPAAEINAVQG